jgi:hypothetical protein
MNVFSEEFLSSLEGDKIFEPEEITEILSVLKDTKKRLKSIKFMQKRVSAKCAVCSKKVDKVGKRLRDGDAVVVKGQKLCHDCFHDHVHNFCASV